MGWEISIGSQYIVIHFIINIDIHIDSVYNLAWPASIQIQLELIRFRYSLNFNIFVRFELSNSIIGFGSVLTITYWFDVAQ